MRRFLFVSLALLLILTSSLSFAAEGDIIHTGLKKLYKLSNGHKGLHQDILSGVDISRFYREMADGRYVNIVEEEDAQLEHLMDILTDAGVDLSDSQAISDFLGQQSDLADDLKGISEDISKTFDDIPNGGSKEDYYGPSPKVEVEKTDMGSLKKGSNLVAAISIDGLEDSNYRIIALDGPLAKVYEDDSFPNAKDYIPGEDFVVIREDLLSSNFKKYIYLFKLEAGKIVEYGEFIVGKDGVSLPPTKLSADTHYIGPVPGDTDGTTIFTKLDFDGSSSFKYVLSKEIIHTPILESSFSSIDNGLVVGTEIKASIGDHLMLLALDGEDKAIAYAKFQLVEENIKGITPPIFEILPEKGNGESTSKVKGISLNDGAHKWMYAIGKNLPDPVLDRPYKNAKNYVLGADIRGEVDDILMIFETDSAGEVKGFGKAKLDKDMIKAGLAKDLVRDTHFRGPEKGDQPGTIRFEYLSYEDLEFVYFHSNEEITPPEMDEDLLSTRSGGQDVEFEGSGTLDMEIFDKDDPILKSDTGFRHYLLVVALDNDNKAKAYANFELNNLNVKLPLAGKLNTGFNVNFTTPEKGSLPNTTMIRKTDNIGLDPSVTSFRYKIVDAETHIEYNSRVQGVSELRQGVNIPVQLGGNKYLLILAVDSGGRAKYYDLVKLIPDYVKSPEADKLVEGTHYKKPVPGVVNHSTKFTFLQLPENTTKWMYKVGPDNFGFIEAGVKMEGALSLTSVDMDITPVSFGDYLLLLAVDDSDKVVSSTQIRLDDSHVKGGKAGEILEGNYKVAKGSSPKTTKLYDFDILGLKDPNNTRWKVKWVNEVPADNQKPYVGSVVDGISGYYRENTDIVVEETDSGKYGYLLLLATDNLGKTKAYKYIELDSSNVREHAPLMDGVSLGKGSGIDSVKLEGLVPGETYKYILTDKSFGTPSAGDSLPLNPRDYTIGEDVRVKFGQYLTIFELDKDGRIGRYASFVIDPSAEVVNQGSGEFTLESGDLEDKALLEGEIINGGRKLSITLDGADWVDGLADNLDLRNKLFRGLVANNQPGEWNKVITYLINEGYANIQVNGSKLSIALVGTSSYDIKEEQKISMTIHPDLIKNALNPVYATGEVVIKPTVRANISGNLVEEIVRAKDIETGGKTIVITLFDGDWKIDLDQSKLLSGFSGGDNWDEISSKLEHGDIVRRSNKEVIITLPSIDIDWDWGTKTEVVELKIDKDLLINAAEDVIATPSFTLYPDILQVKGEAIIDGKRTDTVKVKANDGKQIHPDHNMWKIKVIEGSLKEDFSIRDLTLSGLPRGLVATASRAEGNIIEIRVTGASATPINDLDIYAIINGTGVNEPNSVSSEPIRLRLEMAERMEFENVKYTIELDSDKLGGFIKFTGITGEMEYSTDSTDGIKGDWKAGTGEVILSLEPVIIYVREKAQPLVFKKFVLESRKAPENVSIASYSYVNDDDLIVKLFGIEKDNMQYSLNGGISYKSFSSYDEDISLLSDSDLRIRYNPVAGEATEGQLPSKATPKLNGLYLGDVVLAAGDGKILKTTSDMEYSLGSTNGTDGTWLPIRGNEIQISFRVDDPVWIREKSSNINYRKLGVIQQSDKPELGDLEYDISLGKISNKSDKDLEYRIAGGPWTSIWKGSDALGVIFKAGLLEFRVRASGDILASLPVDKAIIPAEKSSPIIEIDDVENKVLTINGLGPDADWSQFEFRVNPSPTTGWKAGTGLGDEDLSGDKMVEIRFKASETNLASKVVSIKFTRNLNLKLVSLSEYAKPPVLNGTSNVMEYQIVTVDSTNPWTKAVNGDTVLPTWFKEYWDNRLIVSLMIRDGRVGQQANTRNLMDDFPGYVTEEGAELSRITYEFGIDGKVVFTGISNMMEYSIDGESWTLGNKDPVEFGDEPIILKVRLKSLPTVSKEYKISRPDAPVDLSINSYKYANDGSSLKIELEGLKDTMEYSIDGGQTWLDSSDDSGLGNLTEASDLRIRYKFKAGDSREGKLSSKASIKLNPLYLGKVSIDINNEDIMLMDTSTDMEYRINNGNWEKAANLYTKVNLSLNDRLWIREKGNERHKWEIGSIGQMAKPAEEDLNKVDYDIGLKKIENKSDLDLEYRIAGGRWIPIDAGKEDTNVSFKAGPLEFRQRSRGSRLASLPVTKVVIRASSSMPVVVYDDVENIIETIDGEFDWDLYEYRILGNSSDKWASVGELRGRDFPGDVKLEIRKKATKEDLPSQIRPITFTKNLELKHVRLSTNVKPFELNGTTSQMEYRINEHEWKACKPDQFGNSQLLKKDGTPLDNMAAVRIIEIRDKNQHNNTFKIYKE